MNTKTISRLLSLLTLLTCSIDLMSQKKKDFEGTITYKLEYFTKDGQLITDRKQRTLGDTSISYIKKGNYVIEYPHSRVEKVIYLDDKSTYYTMFRRYDTIFAQNYKVPTSPIKSYGKIDTTENILGYNCEGYKVTTASGSLLFFYAKSLYLGPDHFKNHKESGYNYYTKDTKSVYLKLLLSLNEYDLLLTAVKIDQTKIDDNVFLVPSRPLKYK